MFCEILCTCILYKWFLTEPQTSSTYEADVYLTYCLLFVIHLRTFIMLYSCIACIVCTKIYYNRYIYLKNIQSQLSLRIESTMAIRLNFPKIFGAKLKDEGENFTGYKCDYCIIKIKLWG